MIERLYDIVEYRSRICALMARGMTQRAATVVIDACMYGEGCLEGRVREQIEKEKEEV